jgi:hypothetical protein
MNESIKQVQIALQCVRDQIAAMEVIPQATAGTDDGWGGADVILTTSTHRENSISKYFYAPRVVETPFAKEATWLFLQLKEIFNALIDSCSKIEFYGRLANAVDRYHKRTKENNQSAKGTLTVILNEAQKILDEIASNRFNFMLVASGNAIADDFPKLYFAYGSNMDILQMSNRCPEAYLIGKAVLNGYRFIINSRGVATIVPDHSRTVYGLIWKISRIDEDILDEYEGVDYKIYTKAYIDVIMKSKTIRQVLVYVASDFQPGKPRQNYLELIINACVQQQLPESYVKELQSWQI